MGRKIDAFRNSDGDTITAADLTWWSTFRFGKRPTGRTIPRRAPDVSRTDRDNNGPTETAAAVPMPSAGVLLRRFSDRPRVTAPPVAAPFTARLLTLE